MSDKESILYVIQKTFAMMAFSNSLSYYPSSLILSLGIDPHVQCDVHEFFDLFISTLKAVLSEYHEVGAIVAFNSPLNPRKRLMISFLESVFSVAAA